MPFFPTNWIRMFQTHFVLCTFLGLLILDISDDAIRKIMAADVITLTDILYGSIVSGLIVAASTWILHRLWFRRLRRKYLGESTDAQTDRRATVVGFVCGVLCPLYLVSPVLLLALSLVFLALIIGFARSFLRRVVIILRPGNHPHGEDIARLAFVYTTLVACFTVLNVAVSLLYRKSDLLAFKGFESLQDPLIDSFYLTIVVMTTLGFGDITPLAPGVKILISFQVVIAYLLFALLIGTLTRGILPPANDGKDSGDGS